MSSRASFEKINYLLRPNKSIERKLVFESLIRVGRVIDLTEHRYIGFGSMWFGDFLIAHRLLNISDMWSIEKKNPARAEFNKPFKTIRVYPGTSGQVLSKKSKKNWQKPCIVWLDYDGALDSDVKSDLELLIDKAAINSVVIITVNAEWMTYRPQLECGQRGLARTTIEEILGPSSLADEFSRPYPGNKKEVDKRNFAEFLAQSLINFLTHKMTVSGRESEGGLTLFVPLFSFCHVDGAEMVTVGGIICEPTKVKSVTEAVFQAPAGKAKHKKLDLIQLTIKEKLALDGILPENDDEKYYEDAKANGLRLTKKEIDKYRECYRHFPVFSETAF